ncbi:hypothetical protein BASA50_003266 [Batrachochytrium salamandrivorans]|uniref:N-acetyltransferase domain-containing protein n=1 Tax=Batrachochytrium salamandrivorans TaxID=1357716 RepID=A0ABQ8FIZ8_9FUNG|nr:hypothetical protein BASA50_003266 [Batrachochytrium salamandrivorans]KAJ1336253.1 hypothetical protein BSLG_007481 [Batrachochytrium salamandrivorans]
MLASSLHVLRCTAPLYDEAAHLIRMLLATPDMPIALPLIGHMLHSICSTDPSSDSSSNPSSDPSSDPVDDLYVLYSGCAKPADASLLTLEETQVVLIAMAGEDHKGNSDTGFSAVFAVRTRNEQLRQVAVQLLLQSVKTMMHSKAKGDQGLTLSACPMSCLPFVDTMATYNWLGGIYHLFMANAPTARYNVAIGSSWVDEVTGETFVIDRLQASDIPSVMAEVTVNYSRHYVDLIGLSYPCSEMNCVIRAFPPGVDPTLSSRLVGKPVSWAMTHDDLQLGVLATVDAYRNRKLAARCVEVVSRLQMTFLRSRFGDLLCDGFPVIYGFVKNGNTASSSVMEGCGYRRTVQDQFQWLGVNASSL